ncbi:hypothetical protein ACWC09_32570 [Streptomyces sp. NPDC001617]
MTLRCGCTPPRTPSRRSRNSPSASASTRRLCGWIRQAEADAGERDDRLTTDERAELAALRKENTQLKRAIEVLRTASDAAKPKSQVPAWRQGLAWSALSVDYQRILTALADRDRLHQGPLTCQEMAALFGMDVVPARVEALRSKAKRLVARGWLADRQPGRFTLAAGVTGPGGAS